MARTFFTQNLMNIDWIIFELSRNMYRKIFGPRESGHLCIDWFEIYRLCLYCYVLFAHIISLRLINNFLSNKRLTICNEKLFGQIGSVHFLFEINRVFDHYQGPSQNQISQRWLNKFLKLLVKIWERGGVLFYRTYR